MNYFNNETATNLTLCKVSLRSPMSLTRQITGNYIFPPLFVVGFIGNVLNLFVLNSKGMRSKTNVFLSAMAVSDLCFLVLSLPNEMITFNGFRLSHGFMSFFVNSRMSVITMSNWFSAASIWIAVLVTVERVFAIKAPLQAKFWWKTRKIIFALSLVYALSLGAQVYNLCWATPVIRQVCGNSYVYGLAFINATEFPNLNTYVQLSLVITPILVVVVPTVLLTVLNSCLLYYLYDNRKNMAYSSKTQQHQGNELRVACTVSVIVLSFIFCTSPSAVLLTYGAVEKMWVKPTLLYMEAVTVANMFVIVGKAVNFVLYCSSSKHFRRRLIRLVMCKHKNRAGHYDSSRGAGGGSQRRRSTLTSVMDTTGLVDQGHTVVAWLINTFRPRRYTTIETRLVNGTSQVDGKKHCKDRASRLLDPYHRPNTTDKKGDHNAERRYTHPIEANDSFAQLAEDKRKKSDFKSQQYGEVQGDCHGYDKVVIRD